MVKSNFIIRKLLNLNASQGAMLDSLPSNRSLSAGKWELINLRGFNGSWRLIFVVALLQWTVLNAHLEFFCTSATEVDQAGFYAQGNEAHSTIGLKIRSTSSFMSMPCWLWFGTHSVLHILVTCLPTDSIACRLQPHLDRGITSV